MSRTHPSRFAFLLLIVATQIFSSVLFVPGGEYFGGSVFRVSLLLFFLTSISKVGLLPLGKETRRAVVTCGLLVMWMLISLIWSQDLKVGMQNLSYVLTIMLLIYCLSIIISNMSDFILFAFLFMFCGILVLGFSYFEIITGVHLFRSSLQTAAELDYSLAYTIEDLAWFTFGNPNDLSVHILMVLLFSIFLVVHKWHFFLISILFTLCFYIFDLLGARLVIIGLYLFLIVYGFGLYGRNVKSSIRLSQWLICLFCLALVLSLFLYEKVEFLDTSIFIRLSLIREALRMGVDTLLIGIGSGSFEIEMLRGGLVGGTYGIVNPHNAMGRMFAENGIIGSVLLGFLIFGPLLSLSQTRQAARLSLFIVSVTTTLPLLLSASSDPLSSSTLQLAIALAWVGCGLSQKIGAVAASTQSRMMINTKVM